MAAWTSWCPASASFGTAHDVAVAVAVAASKYRSAMMYPWYRNNHYSSCHNNQHRLPPEYSSPASAFASCDDLRERDAAADVDLLNLQWKKGSKHKVELKIQKRRQ